MRFGTYILIFYFSFGACIPKSDFSQLLKINDLIEHYELHKKEASILGESISFPEFLYLHLNDIDEHDHDSDNDHDNLPLQNISNSVVLYITAHDQLAVNPKIIVQRIFPSYKDSYSTKLAFDIFHPPRFA